MEMKKFLEYDESKFATEVQVNGFTVKAQDGFLIGKITHTKYGYLVEYVNKKEWEMLKNKFYKVVRNGELWSEYEDYEEAVDVANELNAQLDCLDDQWIVEE